MKTRTARADARADAGVEAGADAGADAGHGGRGRERNGTRLCVLGLVTPLPTDHSQSSRFPKIPPIFTPPFFIFSILIWCNYIKKRVTYKDIGGWSGARTGSKDTQACYLSHFLSKIQYI